MTYVSSDDKSEEMVASSLGSLWAVGVVGAVTGWISRVVLADFAWAFLGTSGVLLDWKEKRKIWYYVSLPIKVTPINNLSILCSI